MQAHDSVAVREMAEENVTQYLGETVKLVRLEKARDTPLVSCHLVFFESPLPPDVVTVIISVI